MNLCLNLTIENYGNITYCYSYNQNSTFYILIESISYTYPNLNICPCYSIQYNPNNNNGCYVNMNEKIQNYSNNQNCQYYKIFRNNNFQCNCNKIFRDNYRKSKIEILNIYGIIETNY